MNHIDVIHCDKHAQVDAFNQKEEQKQQYSEYTLLKIKVLHDAIEKHFFFV